MPFLSRRSVDPLIPTTPPKDRSYLQKQSGPPTPRNRAQSEASLFRRVSTLFTVRRKTPPRASLSPQASPSSVGIEYRCTYPRTFLPRDSSDTASQSSLEIRRPSGLGRRASLLESNDTLAHSASFGSGVQEAGGRVPMGFASLPNLLSGAFHCERAPSHPHSSKRGVSTVLSDPILRVVLEFVPRNGLPAVALVSRGFCPAARYALYHSLDVQTLAESPLEELYNILACKKELAALVVSFHCHSWPTWELASLDGQVSSVPSDDVRQAFQNMYNIRSLTLPSFVSILSLTPSLTLSLNHLAILDKILTPSQLVALRGWLATQPSLESLSFPHLEYAGTDPSFIDEWAAVMDPSQSHTTLLSALKSLHASTEIASMLCLGINRPIECLTLDVRGTLYTGLRPSSVIRSLAGVRNLHIIFAPEVDKRTVEKFLGVTGSMLTGEHKADVMKSLEVEVLWTDNDAAETLYRIVTSIISRFRGLETLKLTSPFRSIQARIPAPVSFSLLRRPSPSPMPSPPSTATSFDPPSIYSATVPGNTVQKEFVACGIEKSYAKTWTKHCPSLYDIQFDFSCSTADTDVELCGVWFRRKMPLSLPSAA